MSETETTGMTETASAEIGSSVTPERNQEIASTIAKHGTMEDYAAERSFQEAREAGDLRTEEPAKKQERLERFRRALDIARESGDPVPQPAPTNDPQHWEAGDDREAVVRHAKLEAQYELRAQEFAKKEPLFQKAVNETFEMFPASDHVASAILESPVGPELAFLLAQEPMAINELNGLPPHVAARYIGAIEGNLMMSRQSQAASTQPQPRKVTKAPPPMSQINGGAAPPPKDLSKMSMDEYVAHRMKEENRKRSPY